MSWRPGSPPSPPASRGWAWGAATGWWRTCRTFRRRSWRFWRAPLWARCGRAPRRTSGRGAWWTGSPRSSPRSSSPATATATAARTSTGPTSWRGCARRSQPSSTRSSFPTSTRRPKAIVHSQGGILLEHLKKARLHIDLRPGDRFFWFTTTGWMMWNLLVGGLLAGATAVLYDGSPAEPDMNRLWRLAEETGMTHFGTSAGYLTGCMKAEIEPGRDFDLSALKGVGSTGSPLPPEGFGWVYGHVKEDLWLYSTSGGTDLCTAFVGGVPLLPVRAGELQARSLGAAVHAFDPDGKPVVGAVGEMVITQPMPSMPVFLWNDPDGERYRESYFDVYPGVWRHGDWILVKDHGGCVISGRSDSTINRGGVRMGTSEIYSAVEGVEEVEDSLVVDIPRGGGDSFMPLFVVLHEGAELDDDLKKKIKGSIRERTSPRHVPNDIFAVPEVPKTLNGKKLEVPVKKILSGTPPDEAASRDSLSNPESLDRFAALADTLAN